MNSKNSDFNKFLIVGGIAFLFVGIAFGSIMGIMLNISPDCEECMECEENQYVEYNVRIQLNESFVFTDESYGEIEITNEFSLLGIRVAILNCLYDDIESLDQILILSIGILSPPEMSPGEYYDLTFDSKKNSSESIRTIMQITFFYEINDESFQTYANSEMLIFDEGSNNIITINSLHWENFDEITPENSYGEFQGSYVNNNTDLLNFDCEFKYLEDSIFG